jgi:two-component system, cell cycle response regulator
MTDSVQSPIQPDASGQLVLVLRNLLGERYPDLGEHVNTVARLAAEVAAQIGFAEDQRVALTQAAHLHDIGKLALPESLLRSPQTLTDEEWKLVRRHTIVGEQILIAAGLNGRVTDFVRSSHERFDGAGYPDGLAGEEIPLGARIIAPCDAYDAMTSPRPYRRSPKPSESAVLELMRSSGTQFDPAIVEALTQSVLASDRAAQA